MRKRIIILLLGSALALSLAGCGKKQEAPESFQEETVSDLSETEESYDYEDEASDTDTQTAELSENTKKRFEEFVAFADTLKASSSLTYAEASTEEEAKSVMDENSYAVHAKWTSDTDLCIAGNTTSDDGSFFGVLKGLNLNDINTITETELLCDSRSYNGNTECIAHDGDVPLTSFGNNDGYFLSYDVYTEDVALNRIEMYKSQMSDSEAVSEDGTVKFMDGNNFVFGMIADTDSDTPGTFAFVSMSPTNFDMLTDYDGSEELVFTAFTIFNKLPNGDYLITDLKTSDSGAEISYEKANEIIKYLLVK